MIIGDIKITKNGYFYQGTAASPYFISKNLSSCSCPDWERRRKYTGEDCKHIKEIRIKFPYVKETNNNLIIPENGTDAIKYILKYGEDMLDRLKYNYDVFETKGKIYRM